NRPASATRGTTSRLTAGIREFFRNMGEFSPASSLIYGSAKSIVREMKSDPHIFENTQEKIEQRKTSDPNWTFANQLNAGLALVNALGLSPETEADNEVFLLLPMPRLRGR